MNDDAFGLAMIMGISAVIIAILFTTAIHANADRRLYQDHLICLAEGGNDDYCARDLHWRN